MEEKLEQLKTIGFREAGYWEIENNKGKLKWHLKNFQDSLNVLYAFVEDGHLRYIGKTVRTLQKRMDGYKRGHASQKTNKRIKEKLYNCLDKKATVAIWVLPDNGLLHYGKFHVNLAAGLEDDLIRKLNPPWNGGKKETEDETLKRPLPSSGSSTELL